MPRILKSLAAVFATLLLILCGSVAFLVSDSGQKWLTDKGIAMLSETLGTRVSAKEVTLSILDGGLYLYGFEIDDLQGVTMLHVDTLEVGMEIIPILKGEVKVDDIELHGVNAVFYKEHPDTAANYQFVVEALKKNRKDKHDKKGFSTPLSFEIDDFEVSRMNFSWDIKSESRREESVIDHAHLKIRDFAMQMRGDMFDDETMSVEILNLKGTEENANCRISIKKTACYIGNNQPVNTLMSDFAFSSKKLSIKLDSIVISQDSVHFSTDNETRIAISKLHCVTDNGKPRKNVIKPRRGFFDPGHLDATIDMKATMHNINPDSMSATINSMAIYDKGSGLDIRNLTTEIELLHRNIIVRDLHIALPHSLIKSNEIRVIPDGKNTIIKDSRISSYIILKDIAKPFAPVLSDFSTPLNLTTTVGGDMKRIQFKNIHVWSNDNRIKVTAQGDLCNVLGKKDLCLHFYNIAMREHGNIKLQIINHFSKKANIKMKRQIKGLGNIGYNGHVGIFYKRVEIGGTMFSKPGNVNFEFTLNGFTKYMNGTMSIKNFDLCDVLNIKRLAPFSADFKYDFDMAVKKRPTYSNGSRGKLPRGTITANITGVKYGILNFNHITADIVSDGAEAKGTMTIYKKLANLNIDVLYHQTEKEQWYKYKVRLKKDKKDKIDKTSSSTTADTNQGGQQSKSILKKI